MIFYVKKKGKMLILFGKNYVIFLLKGRIRFLLEYSSNLPRCVCMYMLCLFCEKFVYVTVQDQ